MITLKLSYPHYSNEIDDIGERNKHENLLYKVEQVIGTVAFAPGDLLDRKAVKELCEMTKKFKIVVDKRR
jgi:hypothetical protein